MIRRDQIDEETQGFPGSMAAEPRDEMKQPNRLSNITFVIILTGLSLVLVKSAWMQLFQRDYWRGVQVEAQSRVSHGEEKRGRILDRYGQPMAMDREIHWLAIDPDHLSRCFELNDQDQIQPKKLAVDEILEKLATAGLQFVGRDRQLFNEKISADIQHNLKVRAGGKGKRKRYLRLGFLAPGAIREGLDQSLSEISRELGKSVFPKVETELVRYYPFGTTGSILIGETVRAGSEGLWGMESHFNSSLRKVKSLVKEQMAPGGKQIAPDREAIPGHQGADVQTTIDMTLQAELEHLCFENYQRASARSVSAMVVDPFTGETLAMATVPGLQRGQLTEFANQDLVNGNREGMETAYGLMARLHRVSLEPGSVVKPLILARALELGVPLDLPLDVRSKNQRLDGRRRLFRDSSLLKEKTPEGAVVFSSNIGMVLLGVKHMKKSDVESILRRFGFGSKTGIELPGEEYGQLKPLSRWNRFSWESACYGYEMMVTPVQVLRAYMAIANGGFLLEPTLIRKSQDSPAPIILSERVAGECRRVLGRAVSDGTGRHIVHHVSPEMRELIREGKLKMAGKTGTTKLMDPETGLYSEDKYNSSFVGFAPVDNARFLTVVLVEEPTPENNMYYASKSAAPLGAQILSAAMNLPGFDPFSVAYDDPRESEPLILATHGSADNLSSSGSQVEPARDSGQEGEPDRW